MVRVENIITEVSTILDAYITEDRSVAAISNALSTVEEDAGYRIYSIVRQGTMTVNEKGQWADIEVIAPDFVAAPLCEISPHAEKLVGTPIFRFDKKLGISSVQEKACGFTIWLAEGKVSTKMVCAEILTFYFAKDELVGIDVAKEVDPS